jgi:hypothetical protein
MVALASGRAASWRDLVDARGVIPVSGVEMHNSDDSLTLSIMALVARELGEPSGRWLWW